MTVERLEREDIQILIVLIILVVGIVVSFFVYPFLIGAVAFLAYYYWITVPSLFVIYGIYLYYSNNNILFKNTANNNEYGIYLESACNYNDIINNTINDNTQSGIYLFTNCDGNTITNNTINNNFELISLCN